MKAKCLICTLIVFLCINTSVFAQTKEEIKKILCNSPWITTYEEADKRTIDNIAEPKRTGLVTLQSKCKEVFKENGIWEVYLDSEKIAESKWWISEDGKYLWLEPSENHDNSKYPRFKYSLELKEVSKTKLSFGKSSDKQYRGFENNTYIASQEK